MAQPRLHTAPIPTRSPLPEPSASGKRLLMVVNDPLFFLSHRQNVARAARDHGFEVHVAAPPQPGFERISQAGFIFHSLPLDRWGFRPDAEIKSLLRFVRLYRNVRPDIIHHVTIKPIIYGSLAARFLRHRRVVNAVPGLGQVFSSAGLKAYIRKRLVMFLYRISSGGTPFLFLFQNPEDRSLFIDLNLTNTNQAFLIPGAGVDTEIFSPQPERMGTPIVLLPARLLKHKGIGEFVDAARQLLARGIRADFVVAGQQATGNPNAIPETQLHDWQRQGPVEFRGFTEDMPKLLSQVHIVCLPSYYREGIPKALIEAASCGKPLVATDSPGCREIVRHQENGLLIEAQNSSALAQALETLLSNRSLRAQFGRRGREIVLSDGFSNEDVIEQTIGIYSTLLGFRIPTNRAAIAHREQSDQPLRFTQNGTTNGIEHRR